MDKKQLYIVMAVSALLVMGIMVYRWIEGSDGDEAAEKSRASERAGPESAGSQGPDAQQARRGPGRPEPRREAGRTAPRPERESAKRATMEKAGGQAEPQDPDKVADPEKLSRLFWMAVDRGKAERAARALGRAVELVESENRLLELVEMGVGAARAPPELTKQLLPPLRRAVAKMADRDERGARYERALAEALVATLEGGGEARATSAFQRARAAARSDLERARVMTHLCAFHRERGRLTLAEPLCKEALEKGGAHLALFHAAELDVAEDPRSSQAAARLERSLKLEPAFAPAADALAALHLRRKEKKRAVEVLVQVADSLRKGGRYRAALERYTRAAEIDPEALGALVGRAEALEDLGRLGEAEGAYRKAAKVSPGNVKVRLRLAGLLRNRETLEAIKVLEKAEQIDPESRSVKKALREAREKLAKAQPKHLPEELTRVEGKLLHLVFTTRGGVPRSVVLKKDRYKERGKQVGPAVRFEQIPERLRRQVNLVRTWSEWWLPMRVTFDQSSFSFPAVSESQDWQKVRWDPARKRYRSVRRGEKHAVKRDGRWVFGYRWPVSYEGMAPPKVVIERTYSVDPDRSYAWSMEFRVVNRSDRKQTVNMQMIIPSVDTVEEERSFFNPVSLKKEAICMVGDEVRVRSLTSIFGEEGGCMGCDASTCACRRTPDKGSPENAFVGRVRWAGIDEMYFLFAVATAEKRDSRCYLVGRRDKPPFGVLYSEIRFPPVDIMHRGSVISRKFEVFSGPKVSDLLDDVRVDGQDPEMGEAIDYGLFWILGRPMIYVMKTIQKVVGNWGLAIILLTLLIKLLTLPFTLKQMRSMKAMARLKPEMDKLKEKCGDDKQKFQQEMWAMYKAHKINPLGGCLPMLIQMPIYIAWYQALMVSVDLYRAPLFGWIEDLTKPDTVDIFGYGVPILPLLMGATMFLQQRMTPTTADNTQAKMMMYMMPAMFTFFLLFLPSGLTLYILTNTVLTMIHQWYMNHTD